MTVLSPEPGRIALVRQRRFLVENVTPPPSPDEAMLVDLSGLDDDAQGEPLTVLWEHELDARILEDDGWSTVADKGFDEPALFAAYLRTLSWNCVTATDPNLFQAPFRDGIRIDAYQLDPLRKALRLPRVNLFIADDVGLGKTIEAGLIARELLLRRRIDRIVVACPPAMLDQWQDEMEARFGLTFTILDRAYVTRMRRERGFSVNPWTTHSRFLISYRLLVDEVYASGLRDWLGEFAPQTLLLLDEAHNAAPASGARYAIDSQITRAIRDIAPRFEHRLFLSATPHNGHSNSFSALLEILDPQRGCCRAHAIQLSGCCCPSLPSASSSSSTQRFSPLTTTSTGRARLISIAPECSIMRTVGQRSGSRRSMYQRIPAGSFTFSLVISRRRLITLPFSSSSSLMCSRTRSIPVVISWKCVSSTSVRAWFSAAVIA